MRKLRVLIADDEPLACEGIIHLLTAEPDVEVVAVCHDGKSTIIAIKDQRPDIAFLDVQMPRGSGLDVLAALTDSQRPITIFVTAYDQHALQAFEACAMDYLLKPFTDERFKRALARAKSQARMGEVGELAQRVEGVLDYIRALQGPVSSVAPTNLPMSAELGSEKLPVGPAARSEYADRIVIKSQGDLHFLKSADVLWIEAEGDFVKVHTRGQTQLVRETLQSMESKLDPTRFVRIHRSSLVNTEHIRKVVPILYGDYEVFLADGTKLRLSRNYRQRFKSVTGSEPPGES